MNFRDCTPEELQNMVVELFKPLESASELKAWVKVFFGLDMPIGFVDSDSSSSPVDAMWTIYNTIKENTGNKNPGYIMLSAREGFKCQVKGSKLLTPNGLKNIEDAKIGEEIWTGFSWQKITNHIDDGEKKGIKVKVSGGIDLIGSPIHKYWVLRDGLPQWIPSSELNEQTDLICMNVNTELPKESIKDINEYEIGYFLGLLTGDGGVSSIESKTHKHFTLTTIDSHIREFYYYFVEKHFKSKISVDKRDGINYSIWDKKAIEQIKEWGITASRSWEKLIPKSCYSNLDRMKGFIAGLFDTDGSYTVKGDLMIPITAGPLLRDLQKVLISFGVWSITRDNNKIYEGQKHLVSHLCIGQWEIPKLFELGIEFKAKKAQQYKAPEIPDAHDVISISQVTNFLNLCNSYGHIQIRNRKYLKKSFTGRRNSKCPPYKGISRHKLSHLCNWMTENREHGFISDEDYVKVLNMKEILKNKWMPFTLEKVEKAHFFDLTVENDHSYWSNGSISHNTLSSSILETLIMLHYELCISHMSAIQSQSAKSIQYINYFFNKIQPLLDMAGWVNKSQNKSKVEYRTPNGEDVYIKVIIATLSGANCVSGNSLIETNLGFVSAKTLYDSYQDGSAMSFLSLNHNSGCLEYKKVLNAFTEIKEMVKIKLENGTSIECSPEHKFYVAPNKGYIESKYLEIGQELVSVGPDLEIKDIKLSNESTQMYDFEIKDNHNYFVNNILSHNSEHTPLLFIDEVDVVRDRLGYDEAKFIPGYTKGIYPITVKLSTRKFAFGLMQKEIDNAPISGDQILRWNIIDVTERCPKSRHLPDEPKQDRYVAKSLPLKQISVEQYDNLPDPEKPQYELIKQAYAGCVKCPLLPVCKMRLAHRPSSDHEGLYKPIDVIINNFKKTSPDMAEAQLLCWRPSSKGLVYPRFSSEINAGNVITPERAYETLVGETRKKVTDNELLAAMHQSNIRFFAGVDWGYTHDFVIVIFALIPNGEVWIVDCFSSPGMEFSDQLEVAKQYRDRYKVDKWFCDTAMPASLKSFNNNGMRSPDFKKDVMGGIEALRSKIVDGYGRRLLKVVTNDSTQKIISAFIKHHFTLDTAGNPTLTPDDTPGVADQADAMRYVGQNLFPVKGDRKPHMVTPDGKTEQQTNPTSNQQMMDEIAKRLGGGQNSGGTRGGKGGFKWSF